MMKNRKKLLVAILIGLLVILMFGMVCYAKPTIVGSTSWWVKNRSILQQHDMAWGIIRLMGWKLICVLVSMGSWLRTVYDKTFGLIDVTQYKEINNILNASKGWLLALTTLCISVMGIQIMINKEAPKFFRNIILGILAVSCSLYLFTALNNISSAYKNKVLGADPGNQAYNTVNNNIVDLVLNDKERGCNGIDASNKKVTKGANIKSLQTIEAIEINELLNTHKDKGQDLYGWSDEFQKNIKKCVSSGTASGKYFQGEVNDGFLGYDFINTYYYRYTFDFLTIALELIALMVMYIALSYKNIKIAYDLLVSRVLAYFFSADVGGGEKLKAIIGFIRDMYITLAISVLSIKMYYAMDRIISDWNMLGIMKGIIKICLAYVIIDGPLVAERILGIDAGLQSSITRAMAVGGMVIGGSKAVIDGSKNLAQSAKNGLDKIGRSSSSSNTLNKSESNSLSGSGDVTNASGQSMSKNQNIIQGSGSPGDTSKDSSEGRQDQTGTNQDFMSAKESGNVSLDGSPGDMANTYNVADGVNSVDTSTDNTLSDGSSGGFSDANDNVNDVSASSGYDSSFMNASNSDHSSFINTANNSDSSFAKDQNNEKLTNNTSFSAVQKRDSFNPEFSKAQAMYKPNAPKGSPELRDYNRQITAIVKGKDHAPIPPKDNAPEFKKVNYQNALKVKEAYDKGAKNKSSRKDKK